MQTRDYYLRKRKEAETQIKWHRRLAWGQGIWMGVCACFIIGSEGATGWWGFCISFACLFAENIFIAVSKYTIIQYDQIVRALDEHGIV